MSIRKSNWFERLLFAAVSVIIPTVVVLSQLCLIKMPDYDTVSHDLPEVVEGARYLSVGILITKLYESGFEWELFPAYLSFIMQGLILSQSCMATIKSIEANYDLPQSIWRLIITSPIVLNPLFLAWKLLVDLIKMIPLMRTKSEVHSKPPEKIKNSYTASIQDATWFRIVEEADTFKRSPLNVRLYYPSESSSLNNPYVYDELIVKPLRQFQCNLSDMPLWKLYPFKALTSYFWRSTTISDDPIVDPLVPNTYQLMIISSANPLGVHTLNEISLKLVSKGWMVLSVAHKLDLCGSQSSQNLSQIENMRDELKFVQDKLQSLLHSDGLMMRFEDEDVGTELQKIAACADLERVCLTTHGVAASAALLGSNKDKRIRTLISLNANLNSLDLDFLKEGSVTTSHLFLQGFDNDSDFNHEKDLENIDKIRRFVSNCSQAYLYQFEKTEFYDFNDMSLLRKSSRSSYKNILFDRTEHLHDIAIKFVLEFCCKHNHNKEDNITVTSAFQSPSKTKKRASLVQLQRSRSSLSRNSISNFMLRKYEYLISGIIWDGVHLERQGSMTWLPTAPQN